MLSRPITALAGLTLAAGCASMGETAAAQTRTAVVDGAEIEYVVAGPSDGEPILFIHGAGVADVFRPLAEAPTLVEYRTIRMHRRGYAGSAPFERSVDFDNFSLDALPYTIWRLASQTRLVVAQSVSALELEVNHGSVRHSSRFDQTSLARSGRIG